MIMPLVISLFSIIMILMAMAFYTLVERKFLGYMQVRKGPNKVVFMGLPQPMADAMKLFLKEQNSLYMVNKFYFILSPILSLILALCLWSVYPHNNASSWFSFIILFFMSVSAMNVYSVFLSGWSSNSKYALLGSMRGVAQTISYEISMSLIMLTVLLVAGSVDLSFISSNYSIPMYVILGPVYFMWIMTNLAETNRAPFDFAEGESELVSGFNVEYGSSMFALIFMAEYCNILFMSLLTSLLFMNLFISWYSIWLVVNALMMSVLFIWVRASFPRMRYDLLMMLTWKGFLPLSIAAFLLVFMVI